MKRLSRDPVLLNERWVPESDVDEFLEDCPEELRQEYEERKRQAKLKVTEADINKRLTDPAYLERLRRKRNAKK
jgi:hypothetical protein